MPVNQGVWVVGSDFQFPFQDRRAVELFLQVTHSLRPEGVILLGDIVDFYSLSKYDKNPERAHRLGQEISAATGFLARLSGSVPKDCKLIFAEGDHEARLKKYLWSKAPALTTLREYSGVPTLSVQHQLRLNELGYKYYNYSKPFHIGQLWYYHGDLIRKHSGATARAHCERSGDNILVAHSHRQGYYAHTSWSRRIQGWEIGCLCNTHPEYIKGPPDWQQGFAIVRYGPRRTFGVELVPIVRNKCWVQSMEYTP